MIVYIWSAGTAEGVTDSPQVARSHASGCMRSHCADTALIEQAHFISGIRSLEDGYKLVAHDPYWTGQRRPGGRISWRMRVRQLGRAAS